MVEYLKVLNSRACLRILISRACLRTLKVQFTYWPPQISQKRVEPAYASLTVEHLKVLMVEYLKVMAALTVEPAYASSPLGSST